MIRHGTWLDRPERGPAICRRGLIILSLLLGISPRTAAHAAPPEADAKGVEFFEKHIRPILADRCYSCHSSQAEKVRGGLLLDSQEGWQKGGDLGPSIEAGKPDKSLLIEAVRYKNDSLQMPPKGKLADREIELLTQWVSMGAPAPRTGSATTAAKDMNEKSSALDRDFWSFQSPTDPPVPVVADSAWPRSPLDRFILAELEKKSLKPAPEADRRTLIRRATFDLTGLPPTPEEIAAFLADRSEDAFEKVIDRLLASASYGERWGRHWLDVARYADSNGLDENTAYGNAWRYRDYVIRSMNADKPYDQFLLEQLAGDLLPPTGSKAETHERWIATGFLSLGPKSLAEVDKKKLEMDIVDEQIDTVGRAFMGLTLGCARCHDHKFDPISAADYYGLAGIFQSTKTMDSLTTLAKWHEHTIATEPELARQAEHEKKVKERKAEIDTIVKQANDRLKAAGGKDYKLPEKPENSYPEETKTKLKQLRDALAALEKEAPEVSSTMGVEEGKVVEGKILVRGNHLTPGAPVDRRFPLVLTSATAPSTIAKDRSGRLELALWLVDEVAASAHHAVEHLPDGKLARPEGDADRPGKPAPLALGTAKAGSRGRARLAAGSRGVARPGQGGAGPACEESRLPLRSHLDRQDTIRLASAVGLPAGDPE